MLRTIITVTAIVACSASALSQDTGTTCKPLTEADCKAASACRWTSPKEFKLPNGTPVAIPGVCRFKPGVASALKAAAAQSK